MLLLTFLSIENYMTVQQAFLRLLAINYMVCINKLIINTARVETMKL